MKTSKLLGIAVAFVGLSGTGVSAQSSLNKDQFSNKDLLEQLSQIQIKAAQVRPLTQSEALRMLNKIAAIQKDIDRVALGITASSGWKSYAEIYSKAREAYTYKTDMYFKEHRKLRDSYPIRSDIPWTKAGSRLHAVYKKWEALIQLNAPHPTNLTLEELYHWDQANQNPKIGFAHYESEQGHGNLGSYGYVEGFIQLLATVKYPDVLLEDFNAVQETMQSRLTDLIEMPEKLPRETDLMRQALDAFNAIKD